MTTHAQENDPAMRITSNGRVTIPKTIREAARLQPGTTVAVILDDSGVRIVRADGGPYPERGALAVERLRRHRGAAWTTTDQVLGLTRDDRSATAFANVEPLIAPEDRSHPDPPG